MRFTKVLREYVTEELNKKRLEANESDPLTKAYYARREEAIDRINEVIKEANTRAYEIIAEYNLEFIPSGCSRNLITCYENYIINKKDADARRKRESDRYEKQRKAMQEIEVNCTLGANREEFMEMLNKITF